MRGAEGHSLEVRYEEIEVTRGGHHPDGPPPDMIRRFAQGPPHYYLDGEEITEEEALDLVRRARGEG